MKTRPVFWFQSLQVCEWVAFFDCFHFRFPKSSCLGRFGLFPPVAGRGRLSSGSPYDHVERVVAHLKTFGLERLPNAFEILPRAQRPVYSGKKGSNERDGTLRGSGGQPFQAAEVVFLR